VSDDERQTEAQQQLDGLAQSENEFRRIENRSIQHATKSREDLSSLYSTDHDGADVSRTTSYAGTLDDATNRKALLSGKGRFERFLKVADTAPPRVRAILGAIGEQLAKNGTVLRCLRDSLNPLSSFDFGMFTRPPSLGRFWYITEWERYP
jgi:hypothetical protein